MSKPAKQHVPLDDYNIQGYIDACYAVFANPDATQRDLDAAQAFLMAHVYSYPDNIGGRRMTWAIPPEGAKSHEVLPNDIANDPCIATVVHGLELLAEAKVVRKCLEDRLLETANSPQKQVQLQLDAKPIYDILSILNKPLTEDRDVWASYQTALESFYDRCAAAAVPAQANDAVHDKEHRPAELIKASHLEKYLEECLIDAHVHPKVAKALAHHELRYTIATNRTTGRSTKSPTNKVANSHGTNKVEGTVKDQTQRNDTGIQGTLF